MSPRRSACARCRTSLTDPRRVCPHALELPLPTLNDGAAGAWSTACTACAAAGEGEAHPVCADCERQIVSAGLVVDRADRDRGYAIADLERAEQLWDTPRHPVPRAVPGRWAKVTLANVPLTPGRHLESLWVRIEGREGSALWGKVDNETGIVAAVSLGDDLRFDRRQISAVDWERRLVERSPDHVCRVCDPALRAAEQELDDGDRRLLDAVRKYGFNVFSVPPDGEGAGFTFTVGLHHLFDHPEVIMFGPDPDTTALVVGEIGDAVCRGERFERTGDRTDLFEGATARFMPVAEARYREYLGYAVWFYRGTDFPASQLVWSDRGRRFPGEPGFDERFTAWQTRLDV